MSHSLCWILWFVVGFFGWIWFTYKMRVGSYTWGDVFESALFSFVGPIMLAVVFIVLAHEKLSHIKITKE